MCPSTTEHPSSPSPSAVAAGQALEGKNLSSALNWVQVAVTVQLSQAWVPLALQRSASCLTMATGVSGTSIVLNVGERVVGQDG